MQTDRKRPSKTFKRFLKPFERFEKPFKRMSKIIKRFAQVIKRFPKPFEWMRNNVDKTFEWIDIIKRLVASIKCFLSTVEMNNIQT